MTYILVITLISGMIAVPMGVSITEFKSKIKCELIAKALRPKIKRSFIECIAIEPKN